MNTREEHVQRYTWLSVVLAGVSVAGLLVLAGAAHAAGGSPTWVGIVGDTPRVCDGVLVLSFSREHLSGDAFVFDPDTGPDDAVTLQGWYRMSGDDGRWVTLGDVASGGEGNLRWTVAGRQVPESVRVRRTDTGEASVDLPPVTGCAP